MKEESKIEIKVIKVYQNDGHAQYQVYRYEKTHHIYPNGEGWQQTAYPVGSLLSERKAIRFAHKLQKAEKKAKIDNHKTILVLDC